MKPYKPFVVGFALLFLYSFISPSPTFARGKGVGHSSGSHSSRSYSSGNHSSRSHSSGNHSSGFHSSGKHSASNHSTFKKSSSKNSSKTYSSSKKSGTKKAQGVKRDSHGKIARSEKVKKQFMKQTGYPKGRPGYVVDHVVPLKRGGSDTPSNMQWQTKEAAKAKDKRE